MDVLSLKFPKYYSGQVLKGSCMFNTDYKPAPKTPVKFIWENWLRAVTTLE